MNLVMKHRLLSLPGWLSHGSCTSPGATSALWGLDPPVLLLPHGNSLPQPVASAWAALARLCLMNSNLTPKLVGIGGKGGASQVLSTNHVHGSLRYLYQGLAPVFQMEKPRC